VSFVAAGGGSASSLTDYNLRKGTITFAPGETTKPSAPSSATPRQRTVGDLFLDLQSPVNATIGNEPGTVTSVDND
jgi:hypothetical protein